LTSFRGFARRRMQMFGRIVMMLTMLALVCITSAQASIGWIVYYEDAFQGKVIDTDTKEPIEGAVVVAGYAIRTYGLIESDTDVVDAKEVLTNKKGEFYIPAHIFFSLYPVARGETPEFIIYKPGYTAYPETAYFRHFPHGPLSAGLENTSRLFKKGVTVELKKLTTEEERLRTVPSGFSDMRSRQLPLLYRAINQERKLFRLKEVY
jgi:hypothetical protein